MNFVLFKAEDNYLIVVKSENTKFNQSYIYLLVLQRKNTLNKEIKTTI